MKQQPDLFPKYPPEVLRLRTALHRIDASVDARPLASTGSEVGK